MNISIPPAHMGECADFMDESGTVCPRTAIITPLRVTMVSESAYKITFACNLWKSCQNRECSYCFVAVQDSEINRY